MGPCTGGCPAILTAALLATAVTIGLAVAAAGEKSASDSRAPSGFLVIPPGPVTDRIRVELRLGFRNTSDQPRSYRVTFHADRRVPERFIGEQTITVPSGGTALASAWWPTAGEAGRRRLLYRAVGAGRTYSGSWPLDVVAAPTRALPYLQGAWLDGLSATEGLDAQGPAAVQNEIRSAVRAMNRLGMRILIFTYAEWYGRFFYPGKVEFYDRDSEKLVRAADCEVDVIEPIMAEADRTGQKVFLGLGRSGDLHLLWEFEKPGWADRNRAAIKVATDVARELWERYGHHRSFYGWYLTHEMNDLARSADYYNPVTEFCKSLAPEKPVLIAPAGTPIWNADTIRASKVDIIAPQDAVGSGYMPYVNTWDPNKRIAALEGIYSDYSAVHADTGKHLWTDLEIWEMDGAHGYGHAYPPSIDRVRKQIDIQKRHVDVLTAYAFFGFMQQPRSKRPNGNPRAIQLYNDYAAYLRSLPKDVRPPAFR